MNDQKKNFLATHSPTLTSWRKPEGPIAERMPENVVLETGWGKLIFAHTWADPQALAHELLDEAPQRRNIAFYVPDPHVVLSMAPQQVFLDPSHTFRLWLNEELPPAPPTSRAWRIRPVATRRDIAELNRILAQQGMVPMDAELVWQERENPVFHFLVAEATADGTMVGTITGIDHKLAFDDPENGSSFWALAIDGQAPHPGLGEALLRHMIQVFRELGRDYLDLSVMHDNKPAIGLYHKLGFVRVPVFSLKAKNAINEPLFTPEQDDLEHVNPYAGIILREALRRGIQAEIVDAERGLFDLRHGGRSVRCWESLSELTSAVAMSLCDDKRLTSKLLRRAGLRVAEQTQADTPEQNRAFLEQHGRIVVKPARGEQGKGVIVDVRDEQAMNEAIAVAAREDGDVLLEAMVEGKDLRIVVINEEVVAAALREPAQVVGNGRNTIGELIERQSRRRMAQTGGESRIPLDGETTRCVEQAGYGMDDVLPEGEMLAVRKTANLHTGGVLVDVTDRMHPQLAAAAIEAVRTLSIPVAGLDFLVQDVEAPEYAIIEVNERPGLANHEPQPTAERFVDLLFPSTAISRA
jgi:GNAT-family acetyltransferase (TIGR03103 family)